jgi:hypothetical protein
VQSGNAQIGPEDWASGSLTAATVSEPSQRKEVRPLDDKSSWMRVLITVAVDWRLVLALVALVLLLLVK